MCRYILRDGFLQQQQRIFSIERWKIVDVLRFSLEGVNEVFWCLMGEKWVLAVYDIRDDERTCVFEFIQTLVAEQNGIGYMDK